MRLRLLGRLLIVAPPALAFVTACADQPRRLAVTPPPPETVYVREPNAPRAALLAVSPTSLAFDALGDTARLLLPMGARCASTTESIAFIDAAGLVTSLSNGDTHVRCWQDGQTATIAVHVRQALARVMITADRGLEMGRAGDSLHLSVAKTDRRGTPVPGGTASWSSLTPGIVTVDPATGLARGVADSGTARIVGAVEDLADTVFIQVGAKASAAKLLGRATTTGSARARAIAAAARGAAQRQDAGAITTQAFAPNRPVAQGPTGGSVINARAPRMTDSLFQDPATLAGIQRLIVPSATGLFVERRVIASGSSSLSKHSGALFGGGLDVSSRGSLSLRFTFATGTITGDTTAGGLDRTETVTQGSADVGLAIAPWLTVLGGAESRVYQSGSSLEKWLTLRAGAEAAFNLGGGPLFGFARGTVAPVISAKNDVSTLTAPSFGLEAGLGVGIETQRLSARIMYDIEHYSFPSTTGRKEEFAQLLFRVGYKFGW